MQTDRAAHEAWAIMSTENPRASALLHLVISNMGRHNALVVSQDTLAKLAKCSLRTVKRSLEVLREGNWLDVRQIGPSGTVNAYIVNDRVAWSGQRDGIRYSMFSATIVVSNTEQPDATQIGNQDSLVHIPAMFRDERQLPVGAGLPPISQPSLEGMELDLPTLKK